MVKTRRKGSKCWIGLGTALIFVFVFAANLFAAGASDGGWQVLKGNHFVIHFQNGDAFYGKRILQEAERYYSQIASSLGYQNRDAWLADNRCSIYLYSDKSSYLSSTNHPEWSNASASFEPRKTIHACRPESKDFEMFLKTELPHEIAHLLFREHVGIRNQNVPLWLDEGVALWHEQFRSGASDRSRIRDMENYLQEKMAAGEMIPLAELIRATPGPAWASSESVSMFYAEAYSLVKFLVDRYGEARFTDLLRHLKSGQSLEESLRKNYGSYFQDMAAFEKEWQNFLRATSST